MATASSGKFKTQRIVRCAVYTRVHSDDGRSAIDAQQRRCEAFIQEHWRGGWALSTRVYSDTGFSAMNRARPGLRKLLHDAARQKFDVVICDQPYRLTRDVRHLVEILELFRRHKITVLSTHHTSPASPAPEVLHVHSP